MSAASFDVSDCVWALRQLQWAERVDSEVVPIRRDPGMCYPGSAAHTVLLQRFCLRPAQLLALEQRLSTDSSAPLLAASSKEQHGAVDNDRELCGILSLMDAALVAHGHSTALVAARARRTRAAEERRTQQLERVQAAFARAGAWWRGREVG